MQCRGTTWMSALVPSLLLVLTSGWALAANLATSPGRPMQPAPAKPGLAFHQYLVDLGEPAASEEMFACFRFTNVTEQPITISDFNPSCGCLNPQLRKKTFAPRESGEFLLRTRTANEAPGQKEYTLTVWYDDGQQRETTLLFRVKLPDNQVVVRPRALLFYQFGDKPITQELVVTDRRDKPLDVKDVVCNSPFLQCESQENSVDENGHRQIKVKVTLLGPVPVGRHQSQVNILTADSTFPHLKVPVLIQGVSRDRANIAGQERKSRNR